MNQLKNQLDNDPTTKKKKIKIDKIKIYGVKEREEKLVKKVFFDIEKSENFEDLNKLFEEGLNELKRFNILDECTLHLDNDDFTDETILSINCQEKKKTIYGVQATMEQKKSYSNISYQRYNFLGYGDSFEGKINVDTKFHMNFNGEWDLPIFKRGNFKILGLYKDRNPIGHGKLFDEYNSGIKLTYQKGKNTIGYEILNRDVKEIYSTDPNDNRIIPSSIRDISNSSLKSNLFHSFLFDHRYPKSGFKIHLLTNYSGLGGNVNYIQHQGNFEIKNPIYKDLLFSLKLETNYILPLSKLLYNDKIFYSDHRGLKQSFVGGKELNQEIGGNLFIGSTFKILYPLKFNEILEAFSSNFHSFIQISCLETIQNYNELKKMYSSSSISTGIGLVFTYQKINFEFNYVYPLKNMENYKRFEFGIYF